MASQLRNPSSRAKALRNGAFSLLLASLIWLIFYQNLPASLAGYQSSGPFGAANSMDRFIKIFMIVASLVVIFSRMQMARTLLRGMNPGIWMFVLLAFISIIWSIERSATILRLTSLISGLIACFVFGLSAWDPRRFQRVALPPIMMILIASLVVGVVSPDLAIEVGDDIALKNSWHGITHGKNAFGMLSSFGVIFCAQAWLGRESRGAWAIAGTMTALLCVILSRSNTSLFASALALTSLVLLLRVPIVKRRYTAQVVIAIAAIILLYEAVVQDIIPGLKVILQPVLSLTGKDSTFSARTVIWGIIKDHIALSPWIGSGYGAYWIGPEPRSPSYIFKLVMYLYPTESHNGYLEVVNDLGYAGLTCVMTFIVFFLRQALQLMRIDRNQAALYLALLFQEMVIDMSESDWFSRTNTFTVLVLGSICMSRQLIDAAATTKIPAAKPSR
jgi:exopolysaccharide production protein ExoQ